MFSPPDPPVDPRIHIPEAKANPQEMVQIGVPIAALHRAPDAASSMETELLFGEQFVVHDRIDGWMWGQAVSPVTGSNVPGYVGYISENDVDAATDPTHIITALSAPVFEGPDIKSPILTSLPLNARVSGEAAERFIRIKQGYVHERHIRALAVPPPRDFVSQAERLMGRPYIWGGISARGLDCSGLVLTALRATGIDVPRDSDLQAEIGEAVSIEPDWTGLKRGDLVFWKGHVGIMQSETDLLHANAFHMAVASEPLSTAIARIEKSAGPVTAIRRLKT